MRFTAIFQLCMIAFILTSCDILKRQLSVDFVRNASKGPYDVIIVPGTPYDSCKVSPLYKARVLWAKYLFENGIARNIIFSGAATHSAYEEGLTMKMMADTLGVPAANTFSETQALHSMENIELGVEMAHRLGFSKIAIATDPFQSYYLKHHLKNTLKSVALLPFNINSMPVYYKTTMPLINPVSAKVSNFVPLEKRDLAMAVKH